MKSDDKNLLFAIGTTTIISGCCAFFTAQIITNVLDGFRDTNSMALLLCANDVIASDDQNLENNLNSAVEGLKSCREIATALGVSTLFIGCALVYRIIKKIKPPFRVAGRK